MVFRQHKHPVRPPIGPRMAARRPAPPGPRPAGTTGGGKGRRQALAPVGRTQDERQTPRGAATLGTYSIRKQIEYKFVH